MWQLCFGVGYSSYSSAIDTPIRHSIQPLDPIEVAGHADLNAIRRSAVRVNAEFVIDKLNIIMDRECFVSQMKSTIKVTPIKRWTNQKYASHFETLQACGVLKECKANEVQWYSPYFSVAKDTFFDLRWPSSLVSSAQTSQGHTSLFWASNGRSKLCVVYCSYGLEPFSMYCPSNMLADAVSFRSGRSELPQHQWLQDFSFLRADTQRFWRVRWICDRLLRQLHHMLQRFWNHQYSVRIRRNAKFFNIVLKHHDIHHKLLLKHDHTALSYLGVDVAFVAKRTRAGEVRTLAWRLTKKQNEMVPFFARNTTNNSTVQTTYSARHLCSTIGKVLYSRWISLVTMGRYPTVQRVIQFLRRIATYAWLNSWDDEGITPTDEETNAVITEWNLYSQNAWRHQAHEMHEIRTICVATDASDKFWGAVVLRTVQ